MYVSIAMIIYMPTKVTIKEITVIMVTKDKDT